MRLRNFLIVVEDIDKSVAFYKELFGMHVIRDFDGNVILTDGLVLQDKKIWEDFTGKKVADRANDAELYFESTDIDAFQAKLELTDIEFEYVNELVEEPWGQRVIRIYDPDGHIIEIGEVFEAMDEESEDEFDDDEEEIIEGTVESFMSNPRKDVNLDALFEVEADHKEELVEYVEHYAGLKNKTNEEPPEWEDYWDDQVGSDEEEDEFAEENY